jgi:hypothetical protein
MAGLDPAIHGFVSHPPFLEDTAKTWMRGSSPRMTHCARNVIRTPHHRSCSIIPELTRL